jgi:hypothetical protein
MKKRTIALFLLSGLLVSCAETPTTQPISTIPSIASAVPTQSLSHTFAPEPGVTLTQTPAPLPHITPTLLPRSGLNIKRVAQIGGSINGISVMGDVAYVGMGPRVAAIDISQHEQPRLVGESQPLPGLVTQVLQVSSEPALLLTNAGKFLVLIDTSNPDELKPITQLELAGAVSALVWDARLRILYAGGSVYQGSHPYAEYAGFIVSVAISFDNRFELIDSVVMPERPISLALGEGSIFAGAEGYEGGLYHVKVEPIGKLSIPHLVIASTPEKPLQPTSMQVIGGRLYAAYMMMNAYDITNPDQPLQIWTIKGNEVVRGFNVAGDQLYIFGWTILSEFVRDKVSAPEPIVGSPIGEAASVTALHHGDFLVAYNGLEIYATSSPKGLQLVGGYQEPMSNVVNVAANEKAIFVVDHEAMNGHTSSLLMVLSLPDLNPVAQVTTEFPTDGRQEPAEIALDHGRLYIASTNSVWVYDIKTLQPDLLGKVEIVNGKLAAIAAVTLDEKRLLVTSQEAEDDVTVLTVYDLTDLLKPTKLGSPLSLDRGDAKQITWNGSAIYILLDTSYHSDTDMLYVVDFANDVLTKRDSLQLQKYVISVAVDNDLVALVSTAGLSIISADEPGPLRNVALRTLPEHGKGVAMANDKVLTVVGYEYGAAQLLTFDIQDPANPRRVGAMDIATSDNPTVPILITNSYIILANGSGGVEVLDYGY